MEQRTWVLADGKVAKVGDEVWNVRDPNTIIKCKITGQSSLNGSVETRRLDKPNAPTAYQRTTDLFTSHFMALLATHKAVQATTKTQLGVIRKNYDRLAFLEEACRENGFPVPTRDPEVGVFVSVKAPE